MKTQQKMNCKQANQIDILKIALHEGLTPTKVQGDNAWIKLRNEKTASCKINVAKNIFYDFGTGKGGTTIDFVIALKNIDDVKGALEYLSQFNNDVFSFETQNQRIDMILEELGHKNKTAFNHYSNVSTASFDNTPTYTIKKIQTLQNKALIDYLQQRCINIEIASDYVQEVYYKLNDKNYFALAFTNNKNGYEIRNSYFKGCLGKKAPTFIDNNCPHLLLFEGFIDFLSYLTLYSIHNLKYNVLVLNSVSLIDKCYHHFHYHQAIDSFLDNDKAGKKAFQHISGINLNTIDNSSLFEKHKDLNEFLCSQT